MTEVAVLQLAGLVGILGSAIYAAGDVLFLAPNVFTHGERRPLPVDVSNDRILRRRAGLLEDLARLPYWRLRWGALLGVIGAPLTLAGLWLFYRSVLPAGAWTAVPPTMLFLAATVAGPFVHGSFAYVGETVQTLYAVDERHRPMVAAMMRRQIVTIMICYGPLMLAVIVASVWATYAILTGRTRLPPWVAGVNPVTMTIAWLLLKTILPKRIRDFSQGAGFNIAFMAWFAVMAGTVR
jgi:uncharacterized protein DUF6796